MFYCRGNIFDVGMRNHILGSMEYTRIFWTYEQARTADVVVSQVTCYYNAPDRHFSHASSVKVVARHARHTRR